MSVTEIVRLRRLRRAPAPSRSAGVRFEVGSLYLWDEEPERLVDWIRVLGPGLRRATTVVEPHVRPAAARARRRARGGWFRG